MEPAEPAEPRGPAAGIAAAEAAGLLALVLELMQDPIVEERLAEVDARCGGALAGWQPPWSASEAAGLTLEELSRLPQACVARSAEEFAGAVALLGRQAEGGSSTAEPANDSLTVVVPEGTTEGQLEVIGQLARLAGGRCVCQAEWRERLLTASVLPGGAQIVQLGFLETPATPPASGSSADPPAPAQAPAGPRPPRSATVLKPGFLIDSGESAVEEEAARMPPNPWAAPAEAGSPRPPTPGGGSGVPRVVPCIQFIHLHSLHVAMSVLGEAAALIVGSMELFNHACLQQALAVLDDLSGGLVTSWQPPWSADFVEELTVERLQLYPESTLLGWAMNVDAFVSFLARFAAAGMREGWVPGVGYPAALPGGPRVEELEAAGGAVGSSGRSPSPPPPATAPAVGTAPPEAGAEAEAEAWDDDEDEDDGWEKEADPAACAAADALRPAAAEGAAAEPEPAPERPPVSALVAVLPDVATRWHLDVVGALVSSLGVYMITEAAWRADFAAQGNVPFQVEALASEPVEGRGGGAGPSGGPPEPPAA